MSIFDSDYNAAEAKRPTLKQYLKATRDKKRPNQFHTVLVWFPNKFPTFTIETEKFRYNTAEDSALGKELGLFVQDDSCMTIPFSLSITEAEDGVTTIKVLRSKEKGAWRFIGSDGDYNGMRWTF